MGVSRCYWVHCGPGRDRRLTPNTEAGKERKTRNREVTGFRFPTGGHPNCRAGAIVAAPGQPLPDRAPDLGAAGAV